MCFWYSALLVFIVPIMFSTESLYRSQRIVQTHIHLQKLAPSPSFGCDLATSTRLNSKPRHTILLRDAVPEDLEYLRGFSSVYLPSENLLRQNAVASTNNYTSPFSKRAAIWHLTSWRIDECGCKCRVKWCLTLLFQMMEQKVLNSISFRRISWMCDHITFIC